MKNRIFVVLFSFVTISVYGTDQFGNAYGAGLDPYAVSHVSSDHPVTQAFNAYVAEPFNAYVAAPVDTYLVQPVANNIPQPVVDLAASVKNHTFALRESVQKRVSAMIYDAKLRCGLTQPVVEKELSVWEKCQDKASKAWNADFFGYPGAGKYAIVATVSAAVLASGYAIYVANSVSLEDQVVALVQMAQKNPNIILQKLPAILAQCDNDDMRIDILEYVLSRVVITSEIAKAFNLQ